MFINRIFGILFNRAPKSSQTQTQSKVKKPDPQRQQRVDQMRKNMERRQEILATNPLQMLDELAPTSSQSYQNYYEINPPNGGWKELWILENTKDKIVFTYYSAVPEDIRQKLGINIDKRNDNETINIQIDEEHHLISELDKVQNKGKGTPKILIDHWRFVGAFV